MILDAHTHIFPDEIQKNRQSLCRREPSFRLLYGDERSRLVGKEALLRSMDREGVARSIVCGFPWKDVGLCRESNDYLLHSAREFPDRIIPFCVIPMGSSRQAKKELDRCFCLGMRGVGELAFYGQGITRRDMQILRSALGPLQEIGIPVLLHTNEPVGHPYPGKSLKSLQPIYELLSAVPGVTFILAHWGGGFLFYELMPESARLADRIYYDTAASPFLYRLQIYSVATQIVGPDRILWGSDFPLLSPARYFLELEKCGVPPFMQQKIKGLNAERLLAPHDAGVRSTKLQYNKSDRTHWVSPSGRKSYSHD
jgi:predicted TIM-barrel fold metal-dependent hydrolase